MSENTTLFTRERNILASLENNTFNYQLLSDTNKVFVSGIIDSELEGYEMDDQKFYRTTIKTIRFSGKEDFVPILISDLFAQDFLDNLLVDTQVAVIGEFKSNNRIGTDGKRHLDLFLLVTQIHLFDEKKDLSEYLNVDIIFLDGYICKAPVFRVTPLGREITDFMIAVNQPDGSSDYIPCIAWEKNARLVSSFSVGNRVTLYGRIQSRIYFKKFSPDSELGEYKEAYEISVATLENISQLYLTE